MLTGAMTLASLLLAAPTPERAADEGVRIEIVAQGMHNDTGRMLAMIYDQGDGFPRNLDKCMDYRTASISKGRARTSFSGLEPGTYAILVIHDEDRNGYLKTNVLGMPKEGVGVSGNGSGIPRFKQAKFQVEAGGAVTKTIDIRYL